MSTKHLLGVIFSDDYLNLDFGPYHPLQPSRFIETINIFKKHLQFDLISPKKIDPDILIELDVHSQKYIDIVKKCSNLELKYLSEYSSDTPCFEGIYEWGLLYCGGAKTGCDLVLSNKYKVVFNVVGGFHHAKYEENGGFCVFNDCALILAYLFNKKQKAAYIDIDAHAGDGTYLILYDKPILKISIHEDPRYLYPGRGFMHEVGEKDGYGYTVNIPLPPGAGDYELIEILRQIVVPLLKKYDPDILIIQCGVDGFYLDPLTHLNYTHHGFSEFAKIMRSFRKPILLCPGGGYSKYAPYLHLIITSILCSQDTKIKKIVSHLDSTLPKIRHEPKNLEKITTRIITKIQKNHPIFNILNISP